VKLTVELVPSTAWFLSLYRLLPKTVWHRLKSETFAKEGRKCYICGSEQGLSLHEFWTYDDVKYVQRLSEFHHLCNLCHKIKHLGFWCHTADGREKLAEEGLSREDLINHFCKVNDCIRKDFEEHEKEAFEVWENRSMHQWTQDFGRYGIYIKQKSIS
jgi:hypothetical protein